MGQGLSIGLIGRALPQASPDAPNGPLVPARMGPYRDAKIEVVSPNMNALADEGSYFTASTAKVTGVGQPGTIATALAYAIQATFSDTVAMLALRNTSTKGQSTFKRIFPDYIRIIAGATVPASGTSLHYAIKEHTGSVRASAGSSLVPQGNIDQTQAPTSVAEVLYTPTVAAVNNTERIISRGVMRSVIPVANDEFLFVFGSVEKAAGISLGGTIAQRMIIPVPPRAIGPEGVMLLHVWCPGNAVTAGQFEVEVGYYER